MLTSKTTDHCNTDMILLIDNYDSFTYNLVQRLGEIDPAIDMRVVRNDQITPDEIAELKPDRTSSSRRARARRARPASPTRCSSGSPRTVPMLGVCLGHQCIGHVFGGEVVRNDRDHARQDLADPPRRPGRLRRPVATRSRRRATTAWSSSRETFTNPDFVVSAWTDEGEIMGVRHKTWPLHGVQFHPESFLTVEGPKLLKNFLEQCSPVHAKDHSSLEDNQIVAAFGSQRMPTMM